MDYLAIILSVIALAAAGFAFLRASSSHRILVKRIETLKEKNSILDAKLRKLEGSGGKSNRPANEPGESGRRNQPRHERQEQQHEPRHEQRNEQRQEQRHEQREPREQRQKQRERQPQQSQAQQQLQDPQQPGQPKKRRENRRRNEPMERNNYDEIGRENTERVSAPINLEIAGGDLLAELEYAAVHTPTEAPASNENYSGKKYTIIPEDGLIRQHQLQQQPDSDSYIEVDVPAQGSNITNYRFNLSGNQAFVISQGIDRLENAFSFEKPSNRKVSQVV
ncbi:hypothetical protein OB13_03170, partial [Pontibacter sp. HJ8]